MSIRDIIDFSDFVIPEEAIELTSHAFRKAFQYDSYAGRKRFAAIVLNEPIPLQLEDIGLFTNVQEPSVFDDVKNFFGIAGAPRRISKFTFRARILGENSMHWFYPDPCDPASPYQNDPAALLKLIGLHTECISTEDYQLQSGMQLPNRGDLVWIDLEYGDHGYNLQEGTFVSVMTPKDVEHNITAYASTQNCSPSLAAAFTGGGSGGSANPGLSGLGPAARTEIKPTPFFENLVRGASGPLFPAIVTNAGNVSITGATPPVAAGWSITSRPQRNRASPTPGNKARPHSGVDIGCNQDSDLFAVYPGVISFHPLPFPTQATTNAIITIKSVIDFADGTTKTIVSRFFHVSAYNTALVDGQIVQQGQVVGKSGGDPTKPGSGGTRWTTGPHLHWEVRLDHNKGPTMASHYLYRGPSSVAGPVASTGGQASCKSGEVWHQPASGPGACIPSGSPPFGPP